MGPNGFRRLALAAGTLPPADPRATPNLHPALRPVPRTTRPADPSPPANAREAETEACRSPTRG